MARINTKIFLWPALAGIAALGYYGTWHRYAVSGGLGAIGRAPSNDYDPALAMTHIPRPDNLLTKFTGIKPIDNLLTMLILTFWPGLDGHSPSASLYNIHFAGQVMAPVMAMYVDSWRFGNMDSTWWMRSPTLWMMLAQLVANANTVAWYVGVYALTSIVWDNGPPGKKLMLEEARELNVLQGLNLVLLLPMAMFLGHIVPCMAMGWREITPETRQIWVVIWQFFPVWIVLSQFFVGFIFVLGFDEDTIFSRKTSLQRRSLLASRFVYGLTLCITTFVHISIVTLCFTSVYVPELFNPKFVDKFNNQLSPRRVLMLRFGSSTVPEHNATWTEAVTDFLQWDQAVAFGGMLLWALIPFLDAARSRNWNVRWVTVVPAIVLGYFLLGPGSIVLAVQWAKDEILFHDAPRDALANVHQSVPPTVHQSVPPNVPGEASKPLRSTVVDEIQAEINRTIYAGSTPPSLHRRGLREAAKNGASAARRTAWADRDE